MIASRPIGNEPTASSVDVSKAPLAEVLKALNASPAGLTQADAQGRLSRYGCNELPEEKVNPILKFLAYFWGPIPWMIEAAAILSLLVRHWADFLIILLLLIVNAAVGFWEEYQAGNTLAALKARLALQARAKRDGNWVSVPARELVPGDVIRIRLGDTVPADVRLLAGQPLEVDQAALTGESLPVTRQTSDVVYSGSIVRQGESDALVCSTGVNTFFGKTAHLVETVHSVSHFQRAVLKIGDYLILLAIALVVLILAVALFRGDDMIVTLQFALVLTVAAVPVAMPTVLSVTLAVGARVLAAKEAVVTKLAAIEELAGIDMLCSDKTGTLTQNKLAVDTPFVVENHTADEVLVAAALASRAEDQDAIDLAVLNSVQGNDRIQGYHVENFVPFDPVHKRTEADLQGPDGQVLRVTKGAPQVIIDLAAPDVAVRAAAEKAIDDFASRGYRALGVARAAANGAWQLLGIIPLSDPLRPDSRSTIAAAKQMGVVVKMVTGDAIAIAKEIARQLGLGTNILDASLFGNTKVDEVGQLNDRIETADGFAQVFPEHKYHIVDVLQQRGHIVGMTGDGVNDAPALKKADVGIAVSGATDAARAAAEIVLMTPGLSVIIDAIRESRKIFQRMNSYALYRISETIRVLFFMTLSILAFNFYPVTAVMIVLLALLNDGAILSIAYDNTHCAEKPEAWNMRVVMPLALTLGLTGMVASFGLFYLGEQVWHLNRDTIQTLIYLKLSVAGHLVIFVTRTRGPFWSIRPANLLLGAVLCTQLVATLLAVFGVFMSPIGWKRAAFVWGYALIWFLISDQVKLLAYRILDPGQPPLLSRCD